MFITYDLPELGKCVREVSVRGKTIRWSFEVRRGQSPGEARAGIRVTWVGSASADPYSEDERRFESQWIELPPDATNIRVHPGVLPGPDRKVIRNVA